MESNSCMNKAAALLASGAARSDLTFFHDVQGNRVPKWKKPVYTPYAESAYVKSLSEEKRKKRTTPVKRVKNGTEASEALSEAASASAATSASSTVRKTKMASIFQKLKKSTSPLKPKVEDVKSKSSRAKKVKADETSSTDGDDELNEAEQAELQEIRDNFAPASDDDSDDREYMKKKMEKALKCKREEQLEERRLMKQEAKDNDEDSNDDEVNEDDFDMDTKEGRREYKKALARKFVAGGASDVNRKTKHDDDDDDDEESELERLEKEEEEKGAAMYDNSMGDDSIEEANLKTKELEAIRQREEDKETVRRYKAFEKMNESRLDGYERLTDDEESNVECTKMEVDSVKVEDTSSSMPVVSKSTMQSKLSGSEALRLKIRAAAAAKKKKQQQEMEAKQKKEVVKQEEAEAEAEEEEEPSREDILAKLRPRMLHECLLPAKTLEMAKMQAETILEHMRTTPGFVPADEESGQTQEELIKFMSSTRFTENAMAFYHTQLSRVMLYIMCVCDPKKVSTLMNTTLQACSQFAGNYGDDMLWTARNKRMLFDGDDVRPIDVAYTLHEMEKLPSFLPPNFTESIESSLLLSFFYNEAFKTTMTKMVATADDVRIMNEKLSSPWTCALTGVEISDGTPLMCITSAPCPIADLASRDTWLRKCVTAQAFDGLKTLEDFKKSAYSKSELMFAPLCAFIIDDKALLAMTDKKRKADDTEGEESDGAQPEKKRMRHTFDVMAVPFPPEEKFERTRASMQDVDISYRMVPIKKDRRFVASSHAGAARLGPGYQYFFTDAAVAKAALCKKWLLNEGRYTNNKESALESDEFLHTALKTLFADWSYDDEINNTASCLLSKLRTMQETSRKPDGSKVLFDFEKFGELIKLVLCLFVHPCETTLLSDKEITGRERVHLPQDCDTSMQIGEIPFGRQVTTNEFVAQFARLVVDAVYENVVMQTAKEDGDGVNLSGRVLFDALVARCEAEASESAEETVERLENAPKLWTGRLKKGRSELRQKLTTTWATVRKEINNFEMSSDVLKTKEAALFFNTLFPLHY